MRVGFRLATILGLGFALASLVVSHAARADGYTITTPGELPTYITPN